MSDDNITAIKNAKYYENVDNLLEEAKGHFNDIVIIGYSPDDSIIAMASGGLNLADVNYLVDKYKQALLAGVYDADEDEG